MTNQIFAATYWAHVNDQFLLLRCYKFGDKEELLNDTLLLLVPIVGFFLTHCIDWVNIYCWMNHIPPKFGTNMYSFLSHPEQQARKIQKKMIFWDKPSFHRTHIPIRPCSQGNPFHATSWSKDGVDDNLFFLDKPSSDYSQGSTHTCLQLTCRVPALCEPRGCYGRNGEQWASDRGLILGTRQSHVLLCSQ